MHTCVGKITHSPLDTVVILADCIVCRSKALPRSTHPSLLWRSSTLQVCALELRTNQGPKVSANQTLMYVSQNLRLEYSGERGPLPSSSIRSIQVPPHGALTLTDLNIRQLGWVRSTEEAHRLTIWTAIGADPRLATADSAATTELPAAA